MNGKYHFELRSKRIRYAFDIKRNITFIEGDSGTGKSTLINLLGYVQEEGQFETGIYITADFDWYVLTQKDWNNNYHLNITNTVIFIDENVRFLSSDDFASYAKSSGNYFVIVSREPISKHSNLPYSISEIYKIKNSGKYNFLVPLYDIKEFIHTPSCIAIEDENTSYDFFKVVADRNYLRCVVAKGKSNLFDLLLDEIAHGIRNILIFADGAAFGPEIYDVNRLCDIYPDIQLWLPESFEFLILSSPMFRKNKEVQDILGNPYQFVTTDFLSWERFFTEKLVEQTHDYPCHYFKKGKINRCYVDDCCYHDKKYCPMIINENKIDSILGEKASIFKSNMFDEIPSKNQN